MSEIPQQALSDAFHSVVAGRRLRTAVFLTFEFDPGFFEQEILPVFLDVPVSQVPEIRLLGLADELRKVDGIAVYYDRAALVAGAQSSRLDIQRIAVSQRTGYFHPKIVLALVDDALIVGVTSANLTRSGWWENVEAAHIAEVTREAPCSFRSDLLDLIRRLRRSAGDDREHVALDAIQAFVRDVSQDEQRMREGLVLPRLFYGDGDVVEFLSKLAGNRLQRCNLEILSPFFDEHESAAPVERLREAFRPREIRTFLPRAIDGSALCSAACYERLGALGKWGRLPSTVMRLTGDLERSLHAKAYRFFEPGERYEALFIGSANLTTAGLHRGGNVESGFFIEVQPKQRPGWWMTVDEQIPRAFIARAESDTLAQGNGWRLSVRYRWQDQTADCFWDNGMAAPPLELLSHGHSLGTLFDVPSHSWTPLPAGIAAAIGKGLVSGSFLTVRIAGEPDAQILVEEEQMTHKPSLLASVTAADILRYWSLLTPEQKKEFLEEHADALEDPQLAMWLGASRPQPVAGGFFSTFAEVYLSFGNLRRAVWEALQAKRSREAVDRLFGQKFDSLCRLVERIRDEQEDDLVRRYVVLLCARQTLALLERDQPDFCASHKPDLADLRMQIADGLDMREKFAFGDAVERDRFFQWFDRWFLTVASPVAMEER